MEEFTISEQIDNIKEQLAKRGISLSNNQIEKFSNQIENNKLCQKNQKQKNLLSTELNS